MGGAEAAAEAAAEARRARRLSVTTMLAVEIEPPVVKFPAGIQPVLAQHCDTTQAGERRASLCALAGAAPGSVRVSFQEKRARRQSLRAGAGAVLAATAI